MMKQVQISKLSDIKSVFNSPSDNEQYYRIIKNSGLNEFENIELAQPIIRQSQATIIWKAKSIGNFVNFNSLTTIQQQEIGRSLELFYEKLKNRAKDFRNITPDFAEKIIQVPSLNSLLIDSESSKIIIVDWGFLEDSFNRSDSLISKLFPKIENSILVKVVDEDNLPVEACEIQFTTNHFNQTGLTNEKGFARFQNLIQGQEFNLNIRHNSFDSISQNFICDGSKEYCIRLIKKKPQVQDIIPPLINEIITEEEEEKEKVLEVPLAEEKPPLQIKFVSSFNRPIKDLEIKVSNDLGEKVIQKTNKEGNILVNMASQKLSFELTRRHSLWNFNIDNTPDTKHIIKLKPLYPWLWWLLILLLIFICLWCLLSDCDCGRTTVHNSNNQTYVPPQNNPSKPEVLNCNSANESGGAGVTKNQHFLGETEGTVLISYNMENVPDKIDVFYEGRLVVSTNEISGNENGYVGANNKAGCCGKLTFDYSKNKDDFCTIVVSGSNKTKWQYSINCPK